MTTYTNSWPCYAALLSDAIGIGKSKRLPLEIRLIFTPTRERRSAADLEFLSLPGDQPPPTVTIRSGSQERDSFDLEFSTPAESGSFGNKKLLAEHGWQAIGSSRPRTLTFWRNETDATDVARVACQLVAGLSQRGPTVVHAEGDDSGLLRSFVVAMHSRTDEVPDGVTPVLYRDLAPTVVPQWVANRFASGMS